MNALNCATATRLLAPETTPKKIVTVLQAAGSPGHTQKLSQLQVTSSPGHAQKIATALQAVGSPGHTQKIATALQAAGSPDYTQIYKNCTDTLGAGDSKTDLRALPLVQRAVKRWSNVLVKVSNIDYITQISQMAGEPNKTGFGRNLEIHHEKNVPPAKAHYCSWKSP